MALASMYREDREALECDLMETYHILDPWQLPLTRVAAFSVGLRADSRIKMKMAGERVPPDIFLLASIADRLSLLCWFKTKDGQNGVNRPASIVESLLEPAEQKEPEYKVFRSGEDFVAYRKKILEEVS